MVLRPGCRINSILVFLSLMPGCSNWVEDPSPTLTPTMQSTAQPSPEGFPIGSYYYQGLFVFHYAEPTPYVFTFFGFFDGEELGGSYAGEWNIAVWYDNDSYEAHPSEADCIIYESMSAQPHDQNSDTTTDYTACVDCDPISLFTSVYLEDNGCVQEFIDTWYKDPFTGEYDFQWEQYFGYRDAELHGWPEDFTQYEQSLAELRASGTIYDLVRKGDSFSEHYYVLPLPEDAKSSAKSGPLFTPEGPSILWQP